LNVKKTRLHIASELGFCMGVLRSIETAERVREENAGQVTMLHELIHNQQVVESLKMKGIEQADSPEDVESGVVIVSAHGTRPETIETAEQKGLTVVDSTCPLVRKVHELVERLTNDGYLIYIFGDSEHSEVDGILGRCSEERVRVIGSIDDLENIDFTDSSDSKTAFVSQTTQDVGEFENICARLRSIHLDIEAYNTVCRPTRRRQEAAIELAEQCDFILVVGSTESANSNRLVSVIENHGTTARLISDLDQLNELDLSEYSNIGLTAGASTPDNQIKAVIERLKTEYDIQIVTPNDRFAA